MKIKNMEKEENQVKKFRELLLKRSQVKVSVQVSPAGNLIASVKDFPGCRTQAGNLSELVNMVNDAIYTVFEIPEKYHSQMPSYMPPVELAKALNLYPSETIDKPVEFKIEV